MSVRVGVRASLAALLQDEDTDGDLRITVNDCRLHGTDRGDRSFWLTAFNGRRYQVAGTEFLAHLLEELTLLKEAGPDTADLALDRVFEPEAERISRNIRERFWDALTRRIDEEGLPKILEDEKIRTPGDIRYLYVPYADTVALRYYTAVSLRHPEWLLTVMRLPREVTEGYLRGLQGHHGLLSLSLRREPGGRISGVPFVVPGGRFNEMYGWDTHFIVLGLLEDGRLDLAKAMIDNQVYQIWNYGTILNANRTYYLTRSQPPFLPSSALACFARMPRNAASKAWLGDVLFAAIDDYTRVWMGKDRLTATGLSRYFDEGTGMPPEVDPDSYLPEMQAYARRHGMDIRRFIDEYRAGIVHDANLDRFFLNDRAMRESGHDTSYRLYGRCTDLVTVDLNALLYRYEADIALAIKSVFGGSLRRPGGSVERSASWSARAERRRRLCDQYLWDPQRGMYFDYDIVRHERTGYVSATTLYPLWAGMAGGGQARRCVAAALAVLEEPGGIAGSSEASRGQITQDHPLRQWDYPYGWAPHQMLIWAGLNRYGFHSDARRLAYEWLFTIAVNASRYNGTVPEKFDVVRRTHEVFAEYGNVGTKFSYMTREGFGWTNASFEVGIRILGPRLRLSLDRLEIPELAVGRL